MPLLGLEDGAGPKFMVFFSLHIVRGSDFLHHKCNCNSLFDVIVKICCPYDQIIVFSCMQRCLMNLLVAYTVIGGYVGSQSILALGFTVPCS